MGQTHFRIFLQIEGFLIGVYGGVTGFVAGVGSILIYTLIQGGSELGFPNFPVRSAALRTCASALPSGFIALMLAPIVTVLVSRFLLRSEPKRSIVETLAQTG